MGFIFITELQRSRRRLWKQQRRFRHLL